MAEEIELRIRPFDSEVTFRLSRKGETLGPLEIDQWWMPIPSVYPSSPKSRKDNYSAVVDCFLQLCRQAGSDREPAVAESYLLARLLPHVRPLGSRRVFADGRLGSRAAASKGDRSLDDLLRADPLVPISEVEFRDGTGDIIGPAAIQPDVQTRYDSFCRDLFDGVHHRVVDNREQAVRDVTERWSKWKGGFGRRRGRNIDKAVLDVLSYEARTALHRCYSAAWAGIVLPCLKERYGLNLRSYRFHEFWHLEQTREANPGEAHYFHLFHAHVFGLHPAGAAFVGTAAGKVLLGEWVQAACDPELMAATSADRRAADVQISRAYGRLLRGLLLGVYDYAGRRSDINETRKGRPSQGLRSE
jgi:hypothetical protein